MSVNKIEADEDQINKDQECITAYLSQVKTKMSEMNESIQSLNDTWEGDAKEEFMRLFDADYKYLGEVMGLVKDYCECMHYAVKEYRKCERAVSDIIECLRI